MINTFGMEDYGALHSWVFLDHQIALLFSAVGNTHHLDELEKKWLPTIFRTCPDAYIILLGVIATEEEKTAGERHVHRRRCWELMIRRKTLDLHDDDAMATYMYAEHYLDGSGGDNLQSVLEQVCFLPTYLLTLSVKQRTNYPSQKIGSGASLGKNACR